MGESEPESKSESDADSDLNETKDSGSYNRSDIDDSDVEEKKRARKDDKYDPADCGSDTDGSDMTPSVKEEPREASFPKFEDAITKSEQYRDMFIKKEEITNEPDHFNFEGRPSFSGMCNCNCIV